MGFAAPRTSDTGSCRERPTLMRVRMAASEEALLEAARDYLLAFPCRDLPLLPPTDPRELRNSQDLLLVAVGLLDPGLPLARTGHDEELRQFALEVIRRIQLLRGLDSHHPAVRIAANLGRPAARLH